MTADEDRCRAVHHGFDARPIAIIHEGRSGRAGNRHESVFRVIREIESLCPNVARDHVAVGIVRVRVAIRERGHRVFVIRIVRRVIDSAFAGNVSLLA